MGCPFRRLARRLRHLRAERAGSGFAKNGNSPLHGRRRFGNTDRLHVAGHDVEQAEAFRGALMAGA
jgi:hypothetical protein